MIWHESPAEPPNLCLTPVAAAPAGPRRRASRPLTGWPDPHPQLTGLGKRLIVTDRGDGVQLSGLLQPRPATTRPATARCRW